MAAWVADLEKVGYVFPRLRNADERSIQGPDGELLRQDGAEAVAPHEPFVAPRTPLHWRRYDKYATIHHFLHDLCIEVDFGEVHTLKTFS